MKRTLKHWR